MTIASSIAIIFLSISILLSFIFLLRELVIFAKKHPETYKKCAAEAAHEKRSLVLLRHSSLPAGYDDQAYIFTKSMPAGGNIKLCRKSILPHRFGKIK